MPTETKSAIAPALTPDEWAKTWDDLIEFVWFRGKVTVVGWDDDKAAYAAMALANHALPSDSRRKLNWDYVTEIRKIGEWLMDRGYGGTPDDMIDPENQLQSTADGAALLAIASVLASYLPPRGAEQ